MNCLKLFLNILGINLLLLKLIVSLQTICDQITSLLIIIFVNLFLRSKCGSELKSFLKTLLVMINSFEKCFSSMHLIWKRKEYQITTYLKTYYKYLRNACVGLIRKEKANYYTSLLQNFDNVWNVLSEVIPTKNSKNKISKTRKSFFWCAKTQSTLR